MKQATEVNFPFAPPMRQIGQSNVPQYQILAQEATWLIYLGLFVSWQKSQRSRSSSVKFCGSNNPPYSDIRSVDITNSNYKIRSLEPLRQKRFEAYKK